MAEEEFAGNEREELPDSSPEHGEFSESALESMEAARESMGSEVERAAKDLERLNAIAEGPGYEGAQKTVQESTRTSAEKIGNISAQTLADLQEAMADLETMHTDAMNPRPAVEVHRMVAIGGENVAPPVVSRQEGAVTARRIIDIGSNRPRQGVGGEPDASVVSNAEMIAKMNADAKKVAAAESPVSVERGADEIETGLAAQIAGRQKTLDSLYTIPAKFRNEYQLALIDELEYGNAIDRKSIDLHRNQLERVRLESEKKEIDAQVATVSELLKADPTHPELPKRLKGLTDEQERLARALSENEAQGIDLADTVAHLTRILEAARAKKVGEEVKAEKTAEKAATGEIISGPSGSSLNIPTAPTPAQREGKEETSIADHASSVGIKAIDVAGNAVSGILNFVLTDPLTSNSAIIDGIHKMGTWLGTASPSKKKSK